MSELAKARAFYAKLVSARGGVTDPRVTQAFAAVDRAKFVGPGPWKLFTPSGYLETPTADPLYLYQDALVALAPERRINNGEPSLHARLMDAVAVQSGDRVLHVGAGTGYYTAILAELAGPKGKVEAYEIERDLAADAAANLADRANVTVHARSAAEPPLLESDVIYVNAGATHPLPLWLDMLTTGGRLAFPLTAESGQGVMLLLTKKSDTAFDARVLCGAAFILCVGATDTKASAALVAALRAGGVESVRSLRRDTPDQSAWLVGQGWWLSTRDVS